jgi:hypothetical protein
MATPMGHINRGATLAGYASSQGAAREAADTFRQFSVRGTLRDVEMLTPPTGWQPQNREERRAYAARFGK